MKLTIGQLLSLGTGKLCCDIGGVYEACNGLTGDNLFTHQLPRAFRVLQPWVKGQFPWLALADIDSPRVNPLTWREWVAEYAREHGDVFEVAPLPAGVWEHQDPIAELVRMVGPEKVIVCST